MRLLVTGGAGFIGSALIRRAIKTTDFKILNVDKLTYAGSLHSLEDVSSNPNYSFSRTDICDTAEVEKLYQEFKPNLVINLAAESHVDRSIEGPAEFIKTNVFGTFNMLEVSRRYYADLNSGDKAKFRFHHVSTDEVYGSLGAEGLFTEETPYAPNSPYSASKASSDHLVRAWYHTYGLPVVTTNCSNNYGPYQFPEKLIPLMILNGMQLKQLPVYGAGDNIRDWLYVDDHADALLLVLQKGRLGECYNIGGHNEVTNLKVVETICDSLDELFPSNDLKNRRELIKFVTDRPGHDKRYAIDASKIKHELGWVPKETFETGLKKTVQWYVEHQNSWCKKVSKDYKQERLGLVK